MGNSTSTPSNTNTGSPNDSIQMDNDDSNSIPSASTSSSTSSSTPSPSYLYRIPFPSLPTHSNITTKSLATWLTKEQLIPFSETLGICGLVGYAYEIQHCIGLCKTVREDYSMLLTVTKTDHRHNLSHRHRLIFAAIIGNYDWLVTLLTFGNRKEMLNLRGPSNETLFHYLCGSIPLSAQPRNDILISPFEHHQRLLRYYRSFFPSSHYVQIFHYLATTTNVSSLDEPLSDTYETPLHIAYQHNLYELINAYIDYPDRWNINAIETLTRYTYLQYAIERNYGSIVQWLCQQSRLRCLDNVNLYGNTALIIAANYGATDIIDTLLQYPTETIALNHQDTNGYSALLITVVNNNYEAFKRLYYHPDIDWNVRNQENDTILSLACYYGHTSIVEEILFPSVDTPSPSNTTVTTTTATLTTTTSTTSSSSSSSAALTLSERYITLLHTTDRSGNTPLLLAIEEQRMDIVELLCQVEGIDLTVKNKKGDNPFIVASTVGSLETVQLLLRYSSTLFDINDRNNTTLDTALHCAAAQNHYDIVELLCIQPSLNFSVINQAGNTPFIEAAIAGSQRSIQILLEFAALSRFDPNAASTVSGCTAIYYACIERHPEVVKVLCNSPLINLQVTEPVHGNSLLITCAHYGYINIVRTLLDHSDRFDLYVRNKHGNNALHEARRFRHHDTSEIISNAMKQQQRTRDQDATEFSE